MTTIRPINDIWYCNLVHCSYDYSHSCERREGFQARTKQLHDQYISRNVQLTKTFKFDLWFFNCQPFPPFFI